MRGGKRAIALVLTFVISLTLFGCERKSDTDYHEDIIYTTDGLPSAELSARAEEVFFCLLKYYTNKTGVQNIPEKTLVKLRDISANIRVTIEKTTISDHSYTRFLDLIEEKGYGVIDEMVDGEGVDKTRGLYLDICSLLGDEYIGKVVYDILLYYYDYSYLDNLQKYEKYGYAYLLDDANRMKSAYEALSQHIGSDSFSSVLSSGLAIAELLTFDGAGMMDGGFSDEEILIFIQSIDLSFEISEEGWEYLLGSLLPTVLGDVEGEILLKMTENGDIKSLSRSMSEVISLLRLMQSGLQPSDMSYIRTSDRAGLVGSIFLSLDDEGWQMFFDITKTDLKVDDYDIIFVSRYGDEYLSYKNSLTPVTGDQLRSAVGTDQFYKSLEGYIGSISPAFSYGMNR